MLAHRVEIEERRMSMGQARWWLSVVLACGSSTEIPTVAEDPWAVPEEEPEPEPEPDAGPDISTFPPCGNGGMCNPSNLGGETCQGLGMGEGILACDAVTCTYDTSMCEGTGSGNGGNGSVGVGNGNGNGNGSMGGANGGQNLPFFGTDESGSGNGGGAGSGAPDGGNTPQFFGGGFFGGGFFGGGNDDDGDPNTDEAPGSDNGRDDRNRDEDPMDAGVRRDANI
jgi:hypothetical protein